MSNEPPFKGTLRIDKNGPGNTYRVLLDGHRLEGMLKHDGVRIEWVDQGGPMSEPQVTLTFGADALDVELDAELVTYLERKIDSGNKAAAE